MLGNKYPLRARVFQIVWKILEEVHQEADKGVTENS